MSSSDVFSSTVEVGGVMSGDRICFQIVCSIMEPFTHFSQHMLDSETSPVDGKFTCHSTGHGFDHGTIHAFHTL